MSAGDNPMAGLNFTSGGYLDQRPAPRESWAQLCPDKPEGIAFMRYAFPPGFLVIQNLLNEAACNHIVAECDQQKGVASTVATGEGNADYRQNERRSDYINPRDLSTDIRGLVAHAIQTMIAPLARIEPEWCEAPEILRYPVGGEFLPHADADVFDPEKRTWTRTENRDLSLLIYLNEGFEGGEIQFPNFGLSLPPRRGLLVAFPSDGRYVHAARPVTRGVKYALVTWIAAKGSERVGPPRADAIHF
ncbi:MAG: 2OG-Fe(II) oxygenase [Pseudomonadota bacterium]